MSLLNRYHAKKAAALFSAEQRADDEGSESDGACAVETEHTLTQVRSASSMKRDEIFKKWDLSENAPAFASETVAKQLLHRRSRVGTSYL